MSSSERIEPLPESIPKAVLTWPLMRVGWAVVIAGLGVALLLNDGFYARLAVLPLTAALAVSLLPFLPRSPLGCRLASASSRSEALALRGVAFLVGLQALLVSCLYPGARWSVTGEPVIARLAQAWNDLSWSGSSPAAFSHLREMLLAEREAGAWLMRLGIALVALLGGLSAARSRQSWWFAAALAAYFAIGASWLQTRPNPHIDVFVFQQEACQSLLEHRNPYTRSYPDLYGATDPSFPAAWHRDGQVHVGYVYPPVTLLLDLPSYALLRDHRYAQLLAMTLAAALIGTCAAGPYPKLASLALLLNTRAFMILELGFTEPFTVLGLAAVLWTSIRWPRGLPYAFGFLIATKQYTLFLVPLGLLLVPTWNRRELSLFFGKAAAAGLALTLPLAVWDWQGFVESVGLSQFHTAFRKDSLSYLSTLAYGGVATPVLLWFVGVIFVATFGLVATSILRGPRHPGAFFAASTAAYLVFFAFNKQAFANYYLVVIAAAACSLASADFTPLRREPGRSFC